MAAVIDLRRLEAPVVQAGMGTTARHELAAAVSKAGGLGTIAGVRAPIAAELAAARRLTSRPIAISLLLPFVQPDDVHAAAAADAIVTFWGEPRRLAACARQYLATSQSPATPSSPNPSRSGALRGCRLVAIGAVLTRLLSLSKWSVVWAVTSDPSGWFSG